MNAAEKTGNILSSQEVLKRLKVLDDEGIQSPILRRYKSNDATIEKLGEILRDNPAGVLMLRDELVGLLASWEKSGHEGDRTFYLESWNGFGSFDTDRIGRGEISIPNLCLSVFGGIQPDKLRALLEIINEALANDGTLQRFQVLVYPDPQEWKYCDRIPNKEAREKVYALFEKLADFNPVDIGAAPPDDFNKSPYFHFSDEAQDEFIKWQKELHTQKIPAENNPLIAQHLTKYDKLFPALALILHIVDFIANGASGPVSRHAAVRAGAWCQYLESHARRCYALLADEGFHAARHLSEKIVQGKLEEGFTVRDVRRHQWKHLTADGAVQAALDWLEDAHWIRAYEVKPTAGGRPTTAYNINPKITDKEVQHVN